MNDQPRRHLSDTERADLMALLRERPQASIVTLARDVGVSAATVGVYRDKLYATEGLVSGRREYARGPGAWHCFQCACGAEVVGGPAWCSECRAAAVELVLARKVAA